jgi:hypothetical protein
MTNEYGFLIFTNELLGIPQFARQSIRKMDGIGSESISRSRFGSSGIGYYDCNAFKYRYGLLEVSVPALSTPREIVTVCHKST